MRIAVIGAGIVGVTTAYELAADGHEVVVYERHGTVASETSFANAGVVAPGYVTPWAAPGMPGKVLRHLVSRHAPVRLAMPGALAELPWMWRWWRACAPDRYRRHRAALWTLARYSADRLAQLTTRLGLDYEQSSGYLVLLRDARDERLAEPALALLAELGVAHSKVDAVRCREIEPGLSADTPLRAAIHLPQDGVGNCRQFAQLLKGRAQEAGARFRFGHTVLRIDPGAAPVVVGRDADGRAFEDRHDADVLSAGLEAASLLRPLGLRLPLAAVWGYSVTAPLRHVEAHGPFGPRSALMDERFKVAISRLGQRVRAAGSAELGGRADRHDARAIATLHKVLDDWFPGAAVWRDSQVWKGARPMLAEGPPRVGASGLPGLWLNLGHGSSGWALSCGSARVLADLVGGRQPEIDVAGVAPSARA